MKILHQAACWKVKPKDDAVVNKHSKRQRVKKNDDDDGVGYIVIRLWGLTIGIVAFVASYYHMYATNDRFGRFPLTDTLDLAATLGGFTSNLCQNVHVYANSRFDTFNAYLLQHGAEFDRHTRNLFNVSSSYTIRSLWDSHMQSFYLLGGSEVSANICFGNIRGMKLNAKALVFKGKSAYDAWNGDKTDFSAALQVHELTFNNTCEGSSPLRFSLEATDTDGYYFIVNVSFPRYPSSDIHLPVQVFYHLNRVRYDLAPAQLICKGVTSCIVPLNIGTSQDIVLKFEEGLYSDYFLQSHCEKRVVYWLLMFCVLPVSIATSLSVCCCCCCHCLDSRSSKKKSVKLKDKKTESQKNGHETVGTYGTLNN
ncbi:uncharacterized protein LOC135479680 [Liolophura sinensis]|uniref:uncharacterized protein LOC135479680 n=1 Tax=Liolophura sinensis TaxID=3198878 RepID=UPI0031586C17